MPSFAAALRILNEMKAALLTDLLNRFNLEP